MELQGSQTLDSKASTRAPADIGRQRRRRGSAERGAAKPRVEAATAAGTLGRSHLGKALKGMRVKLTRVLQR